MPQLDTVTFFSQFFWLSVFFLIFYIGMYKFFLPRISRIIKLRAKKISSGYDVTGTEPPTFLGDSILSKGLAVSRHTLDENFQRTLSWVNQVGRNQPNSKKIAQSYIESVGEISLSQNLALQQSSTQIAPKLYGLLLIKSLKKIKV